MAGDKGGNAASSSRARDVDCGWNSWPGWPERSLLGDVGPMIEGTGLKAVFALERAEPRLGGAAGLAEEMEEALGEEPEALELLEELPSLGGVEAGAGAGEGAGWVTGGGAGARAKGRVV